jgi:hypothetical protein
MSNHKKPDKDPYEEHELVKNVIKDPANPINATVLLGYVGKTGSDDSIRLYLNIEFNEYVDIPKNVILHAEKAPENIIEFGGTYIWIPNDAKITRTLVSTRTEPEKIMEGEITKKFVRTSDFESEVRAREEPEAERRRSRRDCSRDCPTRDDSLLCSTTSRRCPTRGSRRCPTRDDWECGTTSRRCPTRDDWECGTTSRRCPSRDDWECGTTSRRCPTRDDWECGTTSRRCPSRDDWECGTTSRRCPSRDDWECGTTSRRCPSRDQWCEPTSRSWRCPTRQFDCEI